MTLVELRDRVIAEGLASVRATEEGARQRGALRGFERCYDLYTPEQFTQAIADDERELTVLCDLYNRGLVALDTYCERRYEQAQIEHVWKVLRVALGIPPFYASAALQYARIVGVRPEEP